MAKLRRLTEDERDILVETAEDVTQPTPEQLAGRLRERAAAQASLSNVKMFRRVAGMVEQMSPELLDSWLHPE